MKYDHTRSMIAFTWHPFWLVRESIGVRIVSIFNPWTQERIEYYKKLQKWWELEFFSVSTISWWNKVSYLCDAWQSCLRLLPTIERRSANPAWRDEGRSWRWKRRRSLEPASSRMRPASPLLQLKRMIFSGVDGETRPSGWISVFCLHSQWYFDHEWLCPSTRFKQRKLYIW